MLYVRFCTVIALLVTAVLPSAGWAQTPRLLRFETPTIAVDTLKSNGGIKKMAFTCHNISDTKVTILEVRTQCGCLLPQFSKKPIEAGGIATVYAELDPKDLYGDLSKSLTVVATNGDYKKFNTLTVSGYVDAGVTPAQVKYPYELVGGLRSTVDAIGMRQILRGETAVKRMVIYNDTQEPMVLKLTKSDHSMSVSAPQILEPAQTGEIEVRLSSAGLAVGKFTKTLTLDVEDVGTAKIEVKGAVK